MLFNREFQNRGTMLCDFRETDSLKNTFIKMISLSYLGSTSKVKIDKNTPFWAREHNSLAVAELLSLLFINQIMWSF